MRARRAGFVLLAFALGLWGVAGIAGGRRPEPDLLPFLKRAWPMASYDRRADGVVVVRRQGEAIGYGASASAAGYGGPITVALAVTPAGAIHAAAFLEYRDTPGLRPSVQGLLGEIVGRSVRDPLAVDDDLDAVTGATQSSLGVAAATRGAAERLAERAAVGQGSLALGAPEGVLLLLFALALYGRHNRKLATRSRRSLRWLALVGSFATLGWLWNRPYVLAFPFDSPPATGPRSRAISTGTCCSRSSCSASIARDAVPGAPGSAPSARRKTWWGWWAAHVVVGRRRRDSSVG